VRSGKSSFALELAQKASPRRYFVATAEAGDAEMAERIARHRRERGADFQTLEAPLALGPALERCEPGAAVVIDCLTLWLSNQLLTGADHEAILERLQQAIGLGLTRRLQLFVVANEVGLGIVPDSALARSFRDLAGYAHQRLAARADSIYFAALGVMLRLSPPPLALVTPSHAPTAATAER